MSERDNFSSLTGALVLLLLLVALADQLEITVGQVVIQGMIVLVLALGVWSISSRSRWRLTRIGFILALLGLSGAGAFLDMIGLDLLWLGALLAYLVLTLWLCVRQVLFTGSIDWNKIVGALCIFLLLGLIWAGLYMAIAEVTPNAFNGLDAHQWYETFADLVYFSFVSLTTLGYGDIGPVAPLARFLAFMEALIGQLYIAIVVASLVGIRIGEYSAAGGSPKREEP